MTTIPITPDHLSRIITLRDQTCLGRFTTLSDTGILTTDRDYLLLSDGEKVMLEAVACIADVRLGDLDWDTTRAWLSAHDYDVLVEVTGHTQNRASGVAGLMRAVAS